MALWHVLFSLLWLTVVSADDTGNFLTYDYKGQRLHFLCPRPGSVPSSSLLHALVTRVPKDGGSSATRLAEWKVSNKQRQVQSIQDRVKVSDGPGEYLNATLEYVTCYDSSVYDYQCLTYVDNGGQLVSKNNSQTFQFIGDISQPAIAQTPLKSQYNEGELLTLNCTALIGTQDNGIVWEAGFEEGSFSPVTGEEAEPTTDKAFEEVQEVLPDCTRHSHFPFKYRVKAEDDGKLFQCRLRRTEQTTRIAIGVASKNKCADEARSGLKQSQTAVPELQVGHQRESQTAVPELQVGHQRDGSAEGGALSTSHLMIIIIAILAGMLAMAGFGLFALRYWKKKPLQPVVVVETPSSSESGYTYRRLPSPPDLRTAAGTSHPARETNTIPQWIANTHHPYLESSLINRNNNSSSHPDIASASVYVSMTAVDRCGEPLLKTGGTDVTQGGRAHAPKAEAETGDLAQDGGRDRSESLYSNQEALKKENPKLAATTTTTTAAADAAADASTCIEKLKAGDEIATVPNVDDDDKSVYVPTFVESI